MEKTKHTTKSKGNIQTHALEGREILMWGFLKSLIKGKGEKRDNLTQLVLVDGVY